MWPVVEGQRGEKRSAARLGIGAAASNRPLHPPFVRPPPARSGSSRGRRTARAADTQVGLAPQRHPVGRWLSGRHVITPLTLCTPPPPPPLWPGASCVCATPLNACPTPSLCAESRPKRRCSSHLAPMALLHHQGSSWRLVAGLLALAVALGSRAVAGQVRVAAAAAVLVPKHPLGRPRRAHSLDPAPHLLHVPP